MRQASSFDRAALETLDEFLMSDRVGEDALMISDLDGFLTALVIGPEPISPSEWLPVVWGGVEPDFEDEEEARQIVATIMARYNEIIDQLEGGGERLAPIFWETPGGGLVAGDWAEGFMDAVRLRPDAWLPLVDDKDGGVVLSLIAGLCCDNEGKNPLDIDESATQYLREQGPGYIPSAVTVIRDFWRSRAAKKQRRATGKIGRNDPCPCGSGRKYKRCCGAN